MLSKAHLCDICGLASTTVQDWIENSTITPSTPGRKGRGNAAKFTFQQVVGAMVAAGIYNGEQGCNPSYVTKVVDAFESATYDWLASEFAKGNTHLITIHNGKPQLGKKKFNSPNVQECVERVKAKWYEVCTTDDEKAAASFGQNLRAMK